MKAIYLLPEHNHSLIYGPDEQRDIASRVELIAPRQDAQSVLLQPPGTFDEVEVIFSGWGMAKMDADFFARFPKLKVLFYGAGAVSGFVTEEVWQRGIVISNANVANGIAVAEYTVAQIYLCLKQVWQAALRIKREGHYHKPPHVAGAYGSTVGIISLGAIGRMVAERLRGTDIHLIAYDPFMTPEQAAALNVELTTLEVLFQRADVITCHTPWLPETEGMLNGRLFRLMKPGANFINTARGAVVNEPELIEVLGERPDLFAVLDVTWPEPPVLGSPLYTLPNVILTPHVAGTMNDECRRMGRMMVEELERWLAGQPLQHQVSRQYARARG
ncbi:MAG: hydroxyacid dehydrogenase [Caldilineaceae bacterium]